VERPLPAAATFPRKRGKDSRLMSRAVPSPAKRGKDSRLISRAVPSPAKRGKVPKADGGNRGWRITRLPNETCCSP